MRIFLSIIAFLIFSTTLFAQSADIQSWNDVQLVLPLRTIKKDKKIDQIVLNLDAIVRLGRNDSYPVDDRLSASIDLRINKFLKLTPGYLYQRAEQVPQQRNYENRFFFAANLEKKLQLFTIRHRSMFEYKWRNFRPNTEIYRSRFQLAYLLKHNKKELFAPFISEEPYYDIKLHDWNKNEFFAGVSRKITPKLSLDVFYVRADGTPVNVNGIGTVLKIKLW